MAGPSFYDTPPANAASDFEISRRPLPPGWERRPLEEWLCHRPPDARTPPQGWKVHVSGCEESAERALERAWDYCVANGVEFKHLRGPGALRMRNAKYAPRGASGKLVTIYPACEAELERVLEDLGSLLHGLPGPYILSDLRIGDGPLYVRYGGFARRHCPDEQGELVPAFEDGEGRLVPDRRTPVFSVPDWVRLPPFLKPHLEARSATNTTGLPYRIEKALHFSNGGGVYQGTDTRTGEKVVLKEARPYAGLAADGADAVTRLAREREMLERLAGIDGVPGFRDHFTLGEHHFLVQDFVEGSTLNTFFARRHPLVDPEPAPERVAAYTGWALRVHAGVEKVIDAIHERGVVFNDLHLFNVMVRPDDSVALIDFEAAAPASARGRQTLANPAFLAPRDRRGTDVDRYGLACLRLALFTPMTSLLALDQGKARQLAGVIAEHFPAVPRAFLDEAVRVIAGDDRRAPAPPALSPGPQGWRDARTALSRAILASATPERSDRLFPGDVEQFDGAALGIAHGAAGVLHALHLTGAGRRPEYEDWLLRKAADPPNGTRLGLYDGLGGVAYVLSEFGHVEAAHTAVEHVLAERWERLGDDLYGGLPGCALVLDHLGAVLDEPAYTEAAWRAAGIVTERTTARRSARPGLMYGESGKALMFIRLYERSGDKALLDHAAAALRSDLDGCVRDSNGGIQVDEGWRTMPYLKVGSVGIGLIVDEYLAHRADERFEEARDAIGIVARAWYYAQPSLFTGRAGMVLHLARRDRRDPVLARHVRALSWHAIPYGDGLAMPGEYLYRLSMDVATGTAGVLLALGAALHDRPVGLPFLSAALPEAPPRPPMLPVETSTAAPSTQPERR